MCCFTILFTWLGFIVLLIPLAISADSDDTSLFGPIDNPSDLDPLWNTDDPLAMASPSYVAGECIPLESGLPGKVRARELCSDPTLPVNDVDLFAPEGPLSIEGSDGSYDTALSDSLLTLNPTSDLLLSVGANCQSSNNQPLGRLRARSTEECKDPPTKVTPDRGWDKNFDWGIRKAGQPDYEWLRLLPFDPAENNDDYCPSVVVGRRYAVCGPNNEAQDVFGWGITLRNVHLCMWARVLLSLGRYTN